MCLTVKLGFRIKKSDTTSRGTELIDDMRSSVIVRAVSEDSVKDWLYAERQLCRLGTPRYKHAEMCFKYFPFILFRDLLPDIQVKPGA